MSNEITVNASLSATKGNLVISQPFSGSFNLTTSNPAAAGVAISIATTSAGVAIPLGSVSTLGWAWLKNLDTTNFLQVGVQVSGTFYPLIKMLPGEVSLFRLGTSTPYARADTAACLMEYTILDT